MSSLCWALSACCSVLSWGVVVHRGHAAGRDRLLPYLVAVVCWLGLAELGSHRAAGPEIEQRMTKLAAAPSGLAALTLVGGGVLLTAVTAGRGHDQSVWCFLSRELVVANVVSLRHLARAVTLHVGAVPLRWRAPFTACIRRLLGCI